MAHIVTGEHLFAGDVTAPSHCKLSLISGQSEVRTSTSTTQEHAKVAGYIAKKEEAVKLSIPLFRIYASLLAVIKVRQRSC